MYPPSVSADGRMLTLRFGTGACVTGWGGLVYPAGPVVVLGSWSHAKHLTGNSFCPALLALRTATVRLARPLGDRVLLDVASGHPVVPGRQ